MSRFYRTDSAARNWRTNIAFWLAGKELWAWRSASVRISRKMVVGYIHGLWEKEMECSCEEAMQHLKERIEEFNNGTE